MKMYKLTAADGSTYLSETKGEYGGNSNMKIYGRMDCPSANAVLRSKYRNAYISHRVFFKDEETAIAAGYRPCGRCMRDKYKLWKEANKNLTGLSKAIHT